MEGCGGGFAVGQFSQQAVEDFNAAIGVHVDNSAQQAVVYIFQCCSFHIGHVVNNASTWSNEFMQEGMSLGTPVTLAKPVREHVLVSGRYGKWVEP